MSSSPRSRASRRPVNSSGAQLSSAPIVPVDAGTHRPQEQRLGARVQLEVPPVDRAQVRLVAREVAGRVLHPGEAGRGQLAGEGRVEIVHGARRDVVHERGRVAGRLQQRQEMAAQLDLGDRIEPRHVRRDGVRPGVQRPAGERDRGAGARAPDLGDDAQRAVRGHRPLDQRGDLVLLEQHALAGGAGHEHAVEPRFVQPVQVRAERVQVRPPVRRERGRDRRQVLHHSATVPSWFRHTGLCQGAAPAASRTRSSSISTPSPGPPGTDR